MAKTSIPLEGAITKFDAAYRFSLLTLVSYFIVTEKNGTRSELAKRSGLAPNKKDGTPEKITKPIDNLYAQLSCDDEEAGKLAAFLLGWIQTSAARLNNIPSEVRLAERKLLGKLQGSAGFDTGIDKVFTEIADTETNELEPFCEKYKGVWHVIRYSAHVEAGLDPIDLGGGEWDAWVVHASMQINPPEPGERFPTFELHYRPGRGNRSNVLRRVFGTVLSLGKRAHMQFIGHELHSEYPLIITSRQSKDPEEDDPIIGLLVRKHDDADVFTGKVALVREQKLSFVELDSLISVDLASKFVQDWEERIPNLREILESVVNRVKYGGKSGLLL